MPRPWKSDGNSGVYGASLVEERPTCAAFLGEIVAQWSHAESLLAHMYAELVVGSLLIGVPQHPGNWIAMETFDLITNFGQRIEMLVKAAKSRRFDAATVDEYRTLLQKLQKANGARIHAAHGRWMIDKRYPTALVWLKNAGGISEALIYETSDFQEALHRVVDRVARLDHFWQMRIKPTLERATKFHIKYLRAMEDFEEPV
ncbi:MAG TPA: hypothetical protein VFN37_08545 [Candidatus Baltobacteraceae bacterium]|nr:hypothetical protein [Candidatus Baltobacteraceae bacterium]